MRAPFRIVRRSPSSVNARAIARVPAIPEKSAIVFCRRSLIDEAGRPIAAQPQAAAIPKGFVLDEVFVQNFVPDSWNGQPVQFLSTFTSEGGAAVLGLPTSAPKADPANPSFVYQRFQNGILFYDAAAGTTGPLPLGEHLKGLITSGKLSADVSEAFVPDA